MTPEIENKYRQYLRLLISYNDFKQAREIAELILSENYFDKRIKLKGTAGQKIRKIWEGLNCTMVIAYSRPFSGNDKNSKNKIPDLPRNILNCLSITEKEIHAEILKQRNEILAHSDSVAWDMTPYFMKFEGSDNKLLIPHHINVRTPILPESVKVIVHICQKLMEAIFNKRLILEKELDDILPVVQVSQTEITELKNKYGA